MMKMETREKITEDVDKHEYMGKEKAEDEEDNGENRLRRGIGDARISSSCLYTSCLPRCKWLLGAGEGRKKMDSSYK